MAEKKEGMFEEASFSDFSNAMAVKEQSTAKLKRIKIGMIIAAISLIIVGILNLNVPNWLEDVLICLFIISVIAAYIVGGGLKTVIRWSIKIGKFCWFLAPFPADLVVLLIGIIVSLVCFIFFPIVFVFMNYLQTKKDLKAAENFLKYYEQAQTSSIVENSTEA